MRGIRRRRRADAVMRFTIKYRPDAMSFPLGLRVANNASSDRSLSHASDLKNGSLLGGFPTNNPPRNNAIAYDRTTRQVLNIVYSS
jgi:hypothetical protein